MNRVRNFFSNKWILGLIGILALSLLIWFGANYIKFGQHNATVGTGARIAIIVFVFAIWLVWNLSQWLVERRQNQALLDNIESSQGDEEDPEQERSREELTALSERFREAMQVLRKARFKSGAGNVSLYQLPWYIIIGPPGSGKTTALVNSGLEFPLAHSHGKEALGGIGGTRNCDWWFTNDAVLIDTAGRYTTQDSHRVYDNSAWKAFLGLLQRYRRRRPINGVLVAISLQDLMVQTAEQRLHQAKTVRSRINELQQQLGIRFPIYLTFTKCDLVAGFSEFFDNLSQAEREQVWGMSFSEDTSEGGDSAIGQFSREFGLLIERLNQRVLWRVHNERNIEQRALLQGFPARMESLQSALADFLKQTFSAHRYDTVPMVRGIYFTSGTQEGSPIDRMMASVSADFGLERDMVKKVQGTGKSYFLHRLLKDVVFPEAELVGVNRHFERATRWLRLGVYATSVVVFLTALLLWTGSLTQNKRYMAEIARLTREFQANNEGKRARQVTPAESLDLLDPLYRASRVYEREEHPLLHNLGLYDGRVDTAAKALYRNQLASILLPALTAEVAADLSRLSADDPRLVETLKTYLMFFNPEKRDLQAITNYFNDRWVDTFSGDASRQQRLLGHLERMLNNPSDHASVPDERLVARARQQLRRVPVAQRLYGQMAQSTQGMTRIDLYSEIGGDTKQLFDVDADDNRFFIPYLFTKAAYKELNFDANSPLLQQLDNERWIYGAEMSGEDFTENDRKKLGAEIKRLYLGEYQQRWQKFLTGFSINGFSSASQAVEVLGKLADPVYSPLLAIAELTAENTRLTIKPELPIDASGVALPVSSSTRRLGSMAAASAGDTITDTFKPTVVDLRFEELQRITATSKAGPARIQEYLSAITKVQEYFIEIDSAVDPDEFSFNKAKARFSGASDAVNQLSVKAKSAPAPFDKWLKEIADNSWSLVMDRAKHHLDSMWHDEVYRIYSESLSGRFPFTTGVRQEARIMEFNNFFKPGGVEQSFRKNHLEPFVDTRTWRLRSLEGRSLGISSSTLGQFKRAERIRKTFFSDGEQAGYTFRVEPTKLDSGVRLFSLEVGEQRVPYSHGPRTSTRLNWRGGESNRVRIIFEDLNETVHRKHLEGDWAWLRLLSMSKLERGRGSSDYLVTFNENGREAEFRLSANGSVNPFDHSLLANYRCPQVL